LILAVSGFRIIAEVQIGMGRRTILLGLALLAWLGLAASAGEEKPCPVTEPNGQAPPGERPAQAHYGNGFLWTGLWPNGKVVFTIGGTGEILANGSLAMKFWWWRGVAGKLAITGRRLDGPAAPLGSRIPDGYGEIGFQSTALLFPTVGCWEVTGSVGGKTLTFVTLVAKGDEIK
jgi:hypothetical protein